MTDTDGSQDDHTQGFVLVLLYHLHAGLLFDAL